MKIKAVYAGSFDPVTNGHLQVIETALELFDSLNILVANNPNKNHHFSIGQRATMVESAISHLDTSKIKVIPFTGITSDHINLHKAKVFIRGLRDGIDLNYELKLEQFIKATIKAKTIYLTPDAKHSFTSSSLVRDFYKTGYIEQIIDYVPEKVFETIKLFYKKEQSF